jgi:hypothetical protein
MTDDLELAIHPDGVTQTIGKDANIEHLRDVGARITSVRRATNIEWEQTDLKEGWVVRAAHNPDLAFRIGFDDVEEESTLVASADKTLPIHYFGQRRIALDMEELHFWEFLPPRES